MKHKIIDKKHNSNNCMVCGIKNEFSLGARFYELDNKELACTFETKEFHQSYPGRLHGGIAAAILDETIGRAIDILEPGTWAVTVELNVKYKKPIPVNAKLKAVGRITSNNRKIFEAEGEIILPDGTTAATCWGKYLKMNDKAMAKEAFSENEWFVLDETDPVEMEI
ncbi:MAG TPA: PaaI family thioesterase [Anaerovoracaceae bacterium]|nr:PaaI family thioesterase [Anaerovoracaceae bacterium]